MFRMLCARVNGRRGMKYVHKNRTQTSYVHKTCKTNIHKVLKQDKQRQIPIFYNQNWLSLATPNLSLNETSLSMTMSATLEFTFRESRMAWIERLSWDYLGFFSLMDTLQPTFSNLLDENQLMHPSASVDLHSL